MWWLRPKVLVDAVHVVVSAQLEHSLSILVHFTKSGLLRTGALRIGTCTPSSIEVVQENKLFIAGDATDDGYEDLV